jgi:leucyl aminopeptidase
MAIRVEITAAEPTRDEVEALILPIFAGGLDRQKHFTKIDAALENTLSAEMLATDFKATANQVLDIPTFGKIPAARVLVVGLGLKKGSSDATLRHALATAVRAMCNVPRVGIVLPEGLEGVALRGVAEAAVMGAYRFTKYLTGERAPKKSIKTVNLYRSGKPTAADKKAVETGVAVGDAVCLARDAVNEPPNELTPEVLAQVAATIAKTYKLKIKVLDKAGIKAAGMHLHYAVGQGSVNEPRFIHLTYAPKGAKKKVVFVGKGLTFDSGGLCIKPAPGMGEMKSDMGGAAAVLGMMQAVAALGPKIEVHAIIGAAENMPDGNAYRPGDIFGTLDGRTVEIVNTDAEGRLVLADALAYARQLKPDLIVDAATLTGACVVALGKACSAFYTADEKLAKQFETSAKHAGEAFWRMPFLEELREQLNSDVADIQHTGDRWGGSITAALFLREFVGEVPWIHCDVAAPVLFDRARGMYPKGGTGHPVLTFVDFVETLSKSA